ncbi:MAG TPA: hypothetical protein VHN98_04130 [Acidimicrobiales bacterium]|nr:hypothetical protein [Acidimicrobiales bacterium]
MPAFRSVASALAAGALVASAFAVPAGAQTAPVATTVTRTEALAAQLGDAGALLDLHLLTDTGFTNTDPSVSDPAVPVPGSYSRLTVAKIASSVLPSSPLNVTVPAAGPYEAKSTGPTSTSVAGDTVAALSGNLAALAPVVTATVLPGTLTASPGSGVVTAALDAGVSGVSAVGGLARIDRVTSKLASTSSPTSSEGSRSVTVGAVDLVDLGALLQGLGINLDKLTVDQVSALLTQLGLNGALPLPSGSTDLKSAVTTLTGLLASVEQTLVVDNTGTVTDVTTLLDSATASLLGTVGITAPAPSATGTTAGVLAQAQALLDQLNSTLDGLLSTALTTLDAAPLVRLEGVTVGVATKAVDGVAGSAATVTGTVGAVKVGAVNLGALDLAGPAATVSGLVSTVDSTVAGVLGALDPGLASVVKVTVLDKATSVIQSGAYTKASAGVTGAAVTVTPPATLTAIVDTINNTTAPTISGLLGSMPQVTSTISALEQSLGITYAALGQPATFKVASVLSESDFAPAAPAAPPTAPAAAPELPRTGGTTTVAIGGALALVAVLLIRRGLRRVDAQPQRIDTER